MICTHLLPRSSATFLKDFLSKKLTTFEDIISLAGGEADKDVLPNAKAVAVPTFTRYESDLSDDKPIRVVVDRIAHIEQERGEERRQSLDDDESGNELNETIQPT